MRRILNKKYVIDARSVLVYSCTAGVGFGVVENISYGLQYGSAVAIMRTVTVFGHAMTATLIGCVLAEHKFGYRDLRRFLITPMMRNPICTSHRMYISWLWIYATWLPILMHGTYDVLLFVAAGVCDEWMWILTFIAYILDFVLYLYVRTRVVEVEKRCNPNQKNLHAMMKAGEIAHPCHHCP